MMNRAWNKDLATLVRGFMIESYLEDGRQNEPVVYGQSITDPCLGWEKTQAVVKEKMCIRDRDRTSRPCEI